MCPYFKTQFLKNRVILIIGFQDFRVIAKFYHGGLANMAFSIKNSRWNSILTNQVPYTNHPPPLATTETQPKH